MVVSERDVVAKLTWRLMPILAAAYFVAIVDRSNIGVAALTMNHDLGLSSAAFGFAAGVFFIPYVLLELPSNLALARFGARWWIARMTSMSRSTSGWASPAAGSSRISRAGRRARARASSRRRWAP